MWCFIHPSDKWAHFKPSLESVCQCTTTDPELILSPGQESNFIHLGVPKAFCPALHFLLGAEFYSFCSDAPGMFPQNTSCFVHAQTFFASIWNQKNTIYRFIFLT